MKHVPNVKFVACNPREDVDVALLVTFYRDSNWWLLYRDKPRQPHVLLMSPVRLRGLENNLQFWVIFITVREIIFLLLYLGQFPQSSALLAPLRTTSAHDYA